MTALSRYPSCILVMLVVPLLLLGVSKAAFAQKNEPLSVRCRSAANPYRLPHECTGKAFDFDEETFTKDWVGLRTYLDELGIKPTASYTTQPMGNPTGGLAQGFTYAATLQASLVVDLSKLIGIPGLSSHALGAWSSGRNLSADYVGNIFTVQSTYSSPNNGSSNLTIGELYLQQKLSDDSIILAAGRLAPQNTFATMPVLNQYVNGAINPIPGHLAINDLSFTGYPLEWNGELKGFTTSARDFKWQRVCLIQTQTLPVEQKAEPTSLCNRGIVVHYPSYR